MLKPTTYILIASLLLLWAGLQPAHAQVASLQVVTQVVEQTFSYRPGFEVNIEGEKAEIVVETWDRAEIRVVIELVSKHPDRKIAERDMAALKHSIKQHGNRIYFRNFISPASGKPQPEAQLKAIYTVTLPNECPVYLKNNFGLANVSNLSRFLRLQTEFSAISLNNLQGEVYVHSRFGDISGNNIHGNVQIDAHRSDITLTNISGDFDIQSQYGILKFFTDQSRLKLNIEGERSDVYFFNPKPREQGYTLTAHYGNITTPADLKFNFLENSQTIKRAVFKPTREMASISIKISFGDIIIRNP
jgi:hypothetical protein